MKKLKNKITENIYIIAFLTIITLPLIQITTNIFPKSKIDENRNKKPLPDIKNFESINEYLAGFEDYYNDNFGFRSSLIELNSNVDLKLFNQSPSNQVFLGKDDYLFYDEELDDYCGGTLMSDEEIDIIARKLEILQKEFKKRNQEFIFSIAPNKSTIYPEYLSDDVIKATTESNLDRLQKALDLYGVNYLDFKKLMLENKPNHELYYKRDTHWNLIASNLAAKEMLNRINNIFGTNYSLEVTNIRKDNYYGDLDRILGINSNILEWTSDSNIIGTGEKIPKTLFYGDSFGGTIQNSISEAFNQKLDLHCKNTPLDLTYSNLSNNNSLVVFQIVERHLNQLKDYNFDIFDNSIDGLENSFNVEKMNLDKNNPDLKLNNLAYDKISEDKYFLSSKSNDSSLEFHFNDEFNFSKLYLDLDKVTENAVIKFYWSGADGLYSEENSIPLLLMPSKTKYLIDFKDKDVSGNNFKIKFPEEINKDLSLNQLNFYSIK